MAATTFSIAPRVPVRAFLIAAVASIVGAAVVVLSQLNAWHIAVLIVGAAILVAGLLLVMVALVAQRASAAELILDDEGYSVHSRAGEQWGTWADVTRITRNPGGARVSIHEGDEKRTLLQFNSVEQSRIEAILTEMSARLDAAKGYSVWDGS